MPDNTALTIREQQLTELETTVTSLVLGKVLHDTVLELAEEGDALAQELRAIEITDAETCALATDALRRRKGWENRVHETIDPYRDAANKVRMKFIALYQSVVNGGAADAETARRRRDAFLDEDERRRRKQEAEAAEQQQKLEQESRKDAARETLALGGSQESADQILNEVSALPAPTLPGIELEGSYGRDRWTWRFESSETATLKKLVQLAAKDKTGRYIGFLQVNESALTAEATGKKKLAKVPGVAFFNDRKRIDRAK